MEELLQALASCVGVANVLLDPEARAPFEADWRGRYRGSALAVVRPASTEEVSAVVCICVAAHVAIVPQGGNTSLCGASVPLAEGPPCIVLSLVRMNRVLGVDPLDDSITVEAGCTLAQVQSAAAESDRLFPLSLASEGSCQIGGNLSTNAGGVHVLRYGNTRDLVLGLEVVLADGQVWNGLRGLRKDNTGYDLKQLFVGAEGTLGIITRAVLKLFPLPKVQLVAWLAVPDPEAALRVLAALRGACGHRVTAFELVERQALELVLKHIPDTRPPLPQQPRWSVLIELADTVDDGRLPGQLEEALADLLDAGLVEDAALANSGAQAKALWALRETISEAQRVEGVSIKHDISLPPSRIPAFLAAAGRALESAFPGVRTVVFGHLGDGNLHYNLSKPEQAENLDFIAATPAVNRIVHDLVSATGGSISAEHGLGQLKRVEIRRYKSALEMDLMQAVKQTLDPENRLNPGKLL